MTYYRLAEQDRQSASWTWKSTPINSLQAVLHLLRTYWVFRQDDIRVFTASSREELSDMLARQNNHQESGSVTAAQFLQERKLKVPEREENPWEQFLAAQAAQAARQGVDTAAWARDVWERHMAAQAEQREASGPTALPVGEYIAATGTYSSLGMNLEEQKRLEIELGPGGDHDTPYLFTLPVALKERLAWLRLQARVQAGELVS